jgi:hydrogenase maturation protease
MQTRVISLGQAAAGDDGVGFAVLEELRKRSIPADVELLQARDPTALISLLETSARVVLVDAAVGVSPGEVIELGAEQLSVEGVQPVSSHGIGISDIIGHARELAPARVSPSIRIVAVGIARPERFRVGLSTAVSAAVGCAADRVLALVRG